MEEYQGKTVAAATAAAAAALNCAPADLVVTVVQHPARGFFGLFAKPAIITAKRKPAPQKATPAPSPASAAPQPAPSPTPASASATPQPPETPAPTSAPASVSGKEGELTPEEIAARHAANQERMEKASAALVDYLVAVYVQLGATVIPTIRRQTTHELELNLKTATPAKVVGHHGRRLNALEVVAATFLTYQGVKDPQVTLDVGDYRARRQQALAKLGQRSVTQVIATKQAVFLDPMPARERKFLHQQLEDDPRVKTYSHGREPYRSLVIALR